MRAPGLQVAVLLLAVSAGACYGAEPLAEYFGGDLVGCWGLEGWQQEEQTVAVSYDASAAGNDGGMEGDCVWSNGALRFDGTGDYVEIADAAALRLTGSTWTVAVWVKPDALANYRNVFQKFENTDAGWGIITRGNGRWGFQAFPGEDTESQEGVLVNGEWYHMVAVMRSDGLSLYGNGKFLTNNASATVVSTALPLHVGGDSAYSRWWSGQLDKPVIVGKDLSEDEIWMLYNGDARFGGARILPEELRP